jgi:homoprotocatechuate degradation regulator HpaR
VTKPKLKQPLKVAQAGAGEARQNPEPGRVFPPFRRSLPMSLLRAREAVMRKFVPSLQQHGLSPQQWRVMRALYEEQGLDISELSRRCFLLKPSLTRIVQNLGARRILKRQRSRDDQRRAIISLTDKGRELIDEIIPYSEERYVDIAGKFGYGKLQLLYELLDELVEKLGSPDIAAVTDESHTRDES